jgi:hypothetical protein|tara:strand:- start:20935 stop:21126 length:192 start_codon:yes stop_codon:yes gene_type:complete
MSKSLAVYANSPRQLTLSQDQQAIAAKPAINQLRRHIGTPYMVCTADSFPWLLILQPALQCSQ